MKRKSEKTVDSKLNCRDVVDMGSAQLISFQRWVLENIIHEEIQKKLNIFRLKQTLKKVPNPLIGIPHYAPEKYRQSCTTLLTCKSWKTLTTPFDASRIRWALLSVAKVDLAS